MKISLIIPCYNEEEVLPIAFKRLKQLIHNNRQIHDKSISWELLFVNDGSKDGTTEILKKYAEDEDFIKVLNFSRNFGHQPAVTAGLHHCDADAAVIMDCDMQDPPEVIPSMVETWLNEGCHGVYAVRESRKGETGFKKLSASLFYKTINRLSEIELPRDTGDFRLVDKTIIQAFCELKEGDKYIRGLIPWLGFEQKPFYYQREAREAGETKYPLSKMIKLAANGILSLSSKPLEKIMTLGFVSLFIAFLVVIYTLLSFFLPGISVEPGWASLMIVILFFSSMNLIALGIIGYYISRIFNESKNRPEYIIESILGE